MRHTEQTEDDLPSVGRVIDFCKDVNSITDRYLPYLRNMIKLDDSVEFEWVYAARDYPQLLTLFECQSAHYAYYGTTDVAVALRSAVRAQQPEKGLLVLFDVNRDMDKDAHAAALMRVAVANFKSPDTRPVVVQTNLKDKWHLFWMDGDKLVEQPFKNNGHAAWFIQTLLSGKMATEENGMPFVNRQRVPDRIIPKFRGAI